MCVCVCRCCRGIRSDAVQLCDVRKLPKTALSDQASARERILHMLTESMHANTSKKGDEYKHHHRHAQYYWFMTYTSLTHTHAHARTSPAFPVARQRKRKEKKEQTKEITENGGQE